MLWLHQIRKDERHNRDMKGWRGRGGEVRWGKGEKKRKIKRTERAEAKRNVSFFFFLSRFPLPAPSVVSHSGARLSVYKSTSKQVRECGQFTKLRGMNVRASKHVSFWFYAGYRWERDVCLRERVWEINALLQVLRELNSSVRGVIELHINFSHCCCKQHVSEKRERERAGEKRNSGDVHGITNHSSAETELARFRKRWCHPIYPNEKLGENKCIGERKNTVWKRSRARKNKEKVGDREHKDKKTEWEE